MSDSENDLFPDNNLYTFRQENSTISAKGPNINRTLRNMSFQNNNILSSTMMPKNFCRQGFPEASLYQNSIYSRRDTSPPMSLRSVPTMQRPNFHDSYYRKNNTQRSFYNGRGASPMSVRSIDSNVSISAVDIAMALKNAQFNKYDMRIIKDAYKNFMKSKSRRRIEKRRKKRFRCDRRQSEDSGEQGSNSSDSSDDCRSNITSAFRDNVPRNISRTDLSSLKNSLKESDIYKYCSENFKQNTLKNTFPRGPQSIHGDMYRNPRNNIGEMRFKAPRSVCSESHVRNASIPVLKDRFKGGNNFHLPSQRFNKSVATSTILEKSSNSSRLAHNQNTFLGKVKQTQQTIKNKQIISYRTDSDEDEMEPQLEKQDVQTKRVHTPQRKRMLEVDDDSPNSKKRNITSSPPKISANKIKNKTPLKQPSPKKSKTNNDFEFVKPSFPIRKPLNGKTKETLISKSVLLPPPMQNEVSKTNIADINETSNDIGTDKQNETQNSSSDVSMRPSFIKRKLFSQKLDVTEVKNIDSSPDGSQLNSYSGLIKEKTKARKIVTNQSCLSRDITLGNSNYLDLIHKIVPPEHINVTNLTNITHLSNTNKTNESHNEKDATDDDKWDVTSIISTCNKSNISDTFTDEDTITFSPKTKKQKCTAPSKKIDKINVEKEKKKLPKDDNVQCKVVLNRVPKNINKPSLDNNQLNSNGGNKIVNYVDNFFETDYETDTECRKMEKLSTVKDIATKVTINKPPTKPITKPRTPPQSKNAIKKSTPIVIPEAKKKPGLKNYFQRMLKGNKENIPNHESLLNTAKTNTKGKKDCQKINDSINNNNNNHLDKIKQIQEIVRKATEKRDFVSNAPSVESTQDKPAEQSFFNNTKSRRVRTPRLQKNTLNVSNNLQEHRPRGRPRKVISTPEVNNKIKVKEILNIDSSPSFNNSMTLRVRNNKETDKDIHIKNIKSNVDDKKNNEKKTTPTKSSKGSKNNDPKINNTKVASNKTKSKIAESKNIEPKTRKSKAKHDNSVSLNTSMTLRVRKQVRKDASYVY